MNLPLTLRLEHLSGHGIELPDLSLGLDTKSSKMKTTIISHGHADHVPWRNSTSKILATQPTIDFMHARGVKCDAEAVEFYQPVQLENATVTLYPAGHILGSAMVFVETEEGSLLYTGDFKYPASPATEGCVFPEKPVDIFIAEATFGLPIYKWKSHKLLFEEIRTFAYKEIARGNTPIFLAYNLGKGQEVMLALAEQDIPMQIHSAGFPLCEIYEKHGISLGQYEKLSSVSYGGKALIMPSNVVDSARTMSIKKKKIAYVSGWASLEARRQQMIVDQRIALSDHIDFYQLLEVSKKISPKVTLITHSPTPEIMCRFLRKSGLEAFPLTEVVSA